MNNMPIKLRRELATDSFYGTCARNDVLHDHECEGDPVRGHYGRMIEWEHALYLASKQVQKKFAIVPLCWWAHRGPGMDKDIAQWIALSRATLEELASISRGVSYAQRLRYLNGRFGRYRPLSSTAEHSLEKRRVAGAAPAEAALQINYPIWR